MVWPILAQVEIMKNQKFLRKINYARRVLTALRSGLRLNATVPFDIFLEGGHEMKVKSKVTAGAGLRMDDNG
jgi:hypothetical protein